MKRLRSSSSPPPDRKVSALGLLIEGEINDMLDMIIADLDPAATRAVAQTCRVLYAAVQRDLVKFDYWIIYYTLRGRPTIRKTEMLLKKSLGHQVHKAMASDCIIDHLESIGRTVTSNHIDTILTPTQIDVTDEDSRSWWPRYGGRGPIYPLPGLDFARAAAHEAKRRARDAELRELAAALRPLLLL